MWARVRRIIRIGSGSRRSRWGCRGWRKDHMEDRIEPRHIQIDASAHCQLACKSCPTASGEAARALGAGHLSPELFAELLDRNPSLREVELSNYGEMFLNPRLAELLRIGWERKVTLHADNGVNLNFAREDALEALVKYGLRSMTCSIDGARQTSYARYRVNGDFDRVIGYVRRINELKRKHKTGFPFLRWQFIVFGHNEREIGDARKLAGELGMQFYTKLSWDDHVSPVRDRQLVQIETGAAAVTREEHYQATGFDFMRGICAQLWRAPVLNWDGRVNGCCRNFWGEFGGNAFQDGLEAAVNSERITYARQMLMGVAPERAELPCTSCDLYQTMKRDGKWLTTQEVSIPPSAITCSIVVDGGELPAADVDLFLTSGHEVDRALFTRPPWTLRSSTAAGSAVALSLASPGPYTIYAIPRHPQLEPVTACIRVEERPAAQEFAIVLNNR
jgi:MoaA/NifB/PqqE/SkfB family radical SAM enzyme